MSLKTGSIWLRRMGILAGSGTCTGRGLSGVWDLAKRCCSSIKGLELLMVSTLLKWDKGHGDWAMQGKKWAMRMRGQMLASGRRLLGCLRWDWLDCVEADEVDE